MKVGVVCPYDWSYPGGVRSHIQGLVRALNASGVQTSTIAPASRHEDEIVTAGRSVALRFNGSVARICMSPKANSILRDFAKGVDLLHVHEPVAPSLGLLAMFKDKPQVATFHMTGGGDKLLSVARPALRLLAKRFGGRIAVSEAARATASRYAGESELIPNGVDYDRIASASPAPALEGDSPLVLFVGRDEPRKGLWVALRAMEIVQRSVAVRFAVAGSEQSDLPDGVKGLGVLTDDELLSAYRSADCVVAPSLGGESFGMVLVEAMAAGACVVASDLPGYMEASGGAALHVPRGDVAATASAIKHILIDDKERARLHDAGRRRAKALDWKVLAPQVVKLYEQALS